VIIPAQLRNAWLARVRYKENPDFDPADLPLTYGLNHTTTVESLDFAVEDESDEVGTSATVRFDLAVEWYHGDEPADSVPFNLAVSLRSLFVWTQPTEKQVAERWLNYNASYLLWPYARSYIAAITSWTHLQTPLTIYTQEVPELPDFESEEDASASSHPLASAE
jgi:hypothetical protein